jgi:hypothetical protein
MARQVWLGGRMASPVRAGFGQVRQAGHGGASARRGAARLAWSGGAGQGMERQGRRGKAMPGAARCGAAGVTP